MTIQYAIFNVSEIDLINFDEVFETSRETLRISIDSMLTFVSWDNDNGVPMSVNNLTTITNIYNHDVMLTELQNSTWIDYSKQPI